ncbi:phosphoenolpyruvate carboxykinase (ATP) [Sporolactobacillus shoreicorticis]|uniref:Phosphoenolpyruvate carboxykinase (ATP) n=1 Tax=Sporolactobacillus shoreicorticis TaxID=1923877 RepID=A0ABW5RZB1_9BACL|nr:phosphoenolpyruvate carboxykinase (ATP) [Sporolactobacillus shoreicorticis]MCO7124899.1 phosphoenolpyruvate carboxykinase (ATP) [Sporolactobacillus shoreicorticis]
MKHAFLETPISELLSTGTPFINLSVPELIEHALKKNEGLLVNNGALAVTTGKYTGRSPKDKFIVKDDVTSNTVDWDKNQHTNETVFLNLYRKLFAYLSDRQEKYIFRGFAGADRKHRLAIQVVNEHAWQNLFCRQLFIEPSDLELEHHQAAFTVLSAPCFKADPLTDGTRSEAFIIISMKYRIVLIGGTEYAGEIKKSVFTVMNYLLPQKGVMPMHCSANQDRNGDTALFFGLSGTGKTTLSNVPDRQLIGDDEHGWSNDGVFNFEGGCYAKTSRLSHENEPQIFDSIQFGTVLENVIISQVDRIPDYFSNALTENTRAAYSLQNVANALLPSIGGHPKAIIFLTADASGVLPPISVLSPDQAMYQFLSGYTSKLAGTERGIVTPESTFSTCFGAPFMPLPAITYAEFLGSLIKQHNASVYLVNTGWTGGPYGVGKRIKLTYTRQMVHAALNELLDKENMFTDPIFGLQIPQFCPGVPDQILIPWKTWSNPSAYQQGAKLLAQKFQTNFKQFRHVPENIRSAGPITQ